MGPKTLSGPSGPQKVRAKVQNADTKPQIVYTKVLEHVHEGLRRCARRFRTQTQSLRLYTRRS
jgi:hypothetical protein